MPKASRTKTPESARAEVFRLLWRVLSATGGDVTLGCSICRANRMAAGAQKGYGVLCIACLKFKEEEERDTPNPLGPWIVRWDIADDVERLEALGFLMPLDDDDIPSDYKVLVKMSRDPKEARPARKG